MFTMGLVRNGAWDLLHNGTKALRANIGAELRDYYEREDLHKHLGSLKPEMIRGHHHKCRQDYALPLPPGCDWKEHMQEQAYIHFLRLIAFAIDERFQADIKQCTAPYSYDEKPFDRQPGIKRIKGFTRMCSKMFAAHRYAKKPRPGKTCHEWRTRAGTRVFKS